MSSEQHIDSAMIQQLRELLEDRFGELVARFVSDGQRRINLLKEAMEGRQFDVIFAEAHGLKGSSRNVGAGPLGDLCAKLEAQGKVACPADDMEQLFAAIEQEFAAVCSALKSA